MKIKKLTLISIFVICLIFFGLNGCSADNNSSKADDNSPPSTSSFYSSDSNGSMVYAYSTTEYSGKIVFNNGHFYFQNTEENIYTQIKESTDISRLFTKEKASVADLNDGMLAFADIVTDVNPSIKAVDCALGDLTALRINN